LFAKHESIKTEFVQKVEQISLLKFSLFQSFIESDAIKNYDLQTFIDFDNVMWPQYLGLFLDDENLQFYNIYHLLYDQLFLLFARGYRRDKYVHNLVETLDDLTFYFLDPVSSDYNLASLSLTTSFWDFYFSFSEHFRFNYPLWLFFKDPTITSVFKNRISAYSQNLFVVDDDAHFFDGALLFLCIAPILFMVALLRLNYSLQD